MAKPFLKLGYTKQQAAAIHQALLKAHLKRDVDWQRLLDAITDKMYEVTAPETTHPEKVLYAGDVTRRLKALMKAVDAAEQAHFYLDDQLLRALDAVRRAVAQHTPGRTTGAPKNYAIRQAVSHLLELFELATGIPPKVSSRGEGYAGNFYPFAVAALTPVFPAQQLGSAILTAYKEWRLAQQYKVKTPSSRS